MKFTSLNRTASFVSLAFLGIDAVPPDDPVRLALLNTLNPSFFSRHRIHVNHLIGGGSSAADFLGFNSQWVRTDIILRLLADLSCDAVVETGTFRGETSLLLSVQTQLKLYSCELDPMHYQVAAGMMERYAPRNAVIVNDDSRAFLDYIVGRTRFERPLFYLDSHWWTEWPLLEELRLIGKHCRQAIVVIDDFKVPHDDGFGYDHYAEQPLEWDYISTLLQHNFSQWQAYYPAYPSRVETGFKRGMLLLTLGQSISEDLQRKQRAYALANLESRPPHGTGDTQFLITE